MITNEKTANEIIEELEAEKTELLKTLESANDLIEADSKMHAKYMEKSIEIIKLAKENERLRKRDAEMQAGIDRMSNILAGQSELDAKGDAAQNMRLRAENERLRMLLSMWWRNAFDKDFWMPKCAVEQTIKAIANNNKEDNK